ARQQALLMLRAGDIPEASLSATPEEAKWWQDLRASGTAVRQSRGDKHERERFISLIQLSTEKSYKPPIPNTQAIVLNRVPAAYSLAAVRKKIDGRIALVAELRPDGFVGEVEIVQGLEPQLDQN